MTDRLFARSSDALAVSSEDFTVLERESLQRILEFAHDPAKKDYELMVCLDTDGTVIHDESQGYKQAPITDAMRRAIAENEGVRLWHNHPSQQSISHSDWWNTGCPEPVEVLAVNNSGSLYVGQISPWDVRYDYLLKQFPRVAADLEFYMGNTAKAAGVDIDREIPFLTMSGHFMNLAMKANDIVRYAFQLSKQNQATLDSISEAEVIEKLVAFATQQVGELLAEAPPGETNQSS